MGVFDEDIAFAREIIAEFGEVCSWVKPAGQATTAKPWEDVREGTPFQASVEIAFFPVGAEVNFSSVLNAISDAPEVPIASEYGLMAGDVPFEPKLEDTLQDSNGKPIEVVRISPLRPNGQLVLYKIWVQR